MFEGDSADMCAKNFQVLGPPSALAEILFNI